MLPSHVTSTSDGALYVNIYVCRFRDVFVRRNFCGKAQTFFSFGHVMCTLRLLAVAARWQPVEGGAAAEQRKQTAEEDGSKHGEGEEYGASRVSQ